MSWDYLVRTLQLNNKELKDIICEMEKVKINIDRGCREMDNYLNKMEDKLKKIKSSSTEEVKE